MLGNEKSTLRQVFPSVEKLTPTSFAFRHLTWHRLSVLPSKVRLKAVGSAGTS